MDWSLFAFGPTGWGDELAAGLLITLAVAISAFVVGTIGGLICGLVELYAPRPLAALVGGCAVVLRSVPELLMLFVVYYATTLILNAGLEALGFTTNIGMSPIAAGIVALAAIHGAYVSEVVKGAIRAVPPDLLEAGRALGMGRAVVFFKVTLPLALRYGFSGISNLWMVVIKNTPFISAIGASDLISQAGTAGQNTKHYFAFFIAVLAIYLVISAISMTIQALGERRLFLHMQR